MNYLFLLVTLVSWSLPTFFWKELRKNLDANYQMILIHIAYSIVIYSYCVYLVLTDKNSITNFKKSIINLDAKYFFGILFFVTLGTISNFIYLTMLKKYDVSKYLPMLKGLSNVMLILFSIFIFKENVTFKRILGITIISIGMALVC